MHHHRALLVALFLALAWPAAPAAQTPCTHFASPSGGGTGRAPGSPFQIRQFWAVARPGSTLCLLDGRYTDSASMIQAPPSVTGTASQPITIRALHEGRVLIDGQDGARPVDLQGSWGILEGINATRGDNANIRVRGSNWKVRRVIAFNGGVGSAHLIEVSHTGNTVEDCAAWGTAEKLISLGSSGGQGNTLRRCWAQVTDAGDAPGGTNGVEQGYGQDTVTFENVLVTWNISGASGAPTGALRSFRTQGSRMFGSMMYLLADSKTPRLNEMFSAYTDGGSPSQFPECAYHTSMHNIYRDIVSFVQPGHPGFEGLRPFTFLRSNTSRGCPTAPAGSGNTATNILGVGGQSPLISTDSYSVTQSRHGATLSAALAGSGHSSIWTLMPGLCTRYVNGTLTSQGLWPWPMNQRILTATAQAGTGVDVTATMEALLGPIPAQCRGGDAPR